MPGHLAKSLAYVSSALREKEDKESASEANQTVVWGGERVRPPSRQSGCGFPPPQSTARLASHADVFFLFDPVFDLFPPGRSLVPG